MKKKIKKEYIVYSINYLGSPIYVGITGDIKRRVRDHNNLCFNKRVDKEVYNFIRDMTRSPIYLIPIKTFKTRIEAKRYEAYLILADLFGPKELKQKVPSISDR